MYEIRVVLDSDRSEENLHHFINGLLRSHGLKPAMIQVNEMEEMVSPGGY